jgi:hypothetical protein
MTIALYRAGFLCIWLVLDRTAQLTQSTFGEAGILICLVVVVTTFGVETLTCSTICFSGLDDCSEGFSLTIALGWMVMCATVPYVVFAFRER